MYTSFKPVREVFERVYRQALEAKGVKVMEVQPTGYLGPSKDYLSLIKSVGQKIHERPVSMVIGPKNGAPVAWVLDTGKLGLVRVNAGVSESDLVELAKKFYEM